MKEKLHAIEVEKEKTGVPRVLLNFNDIIKGIQNQKVTEIENIKPDHEADFSSSKSRSYLKNFRSLTNDQTSSSRNDDINKMRTISNMHDISLTKQSISKKQTQCKPFRLSKSNYRNKRPPQQRKRYCPPVHKPFRANPIPE